MGQEIHARRRGGEFRYRVWSTITDSYLTEECTEAEVALRLVVDHRVREIYDGDAATEILMRLERARSRGTSSLVERAHGDLAGPWLRSRDEAP